MNEQDVRAIVREAIERHLGRPEPGRQGLRAPAAAAPHHSPAASHPSHVVLHLAPGSEMDEGMCVIEPAVRCTHCRFCQSYGH